MIIDGYIIVVISTLASLQLNQVCDRIARIVVHFYYAIVITKLIKINQNVRIILSLDNYILTRL